MAYRLRLGFVDKATAEKINSFSSKQEYLEFYNSHIQSKGIKRTVNLADEEAHIYCPLYDIINEIYDFGSAYNNAEEMYKNGSPLFSSKELKEMFENENPVILDKKGVICAIEFYRNCVIKEMEDVLSETAPYWDKRNHSDRMKDFISKRHNEWTTYREYEGTDVGDALSVYCLNPKTDCIVNSWFFEYQIFELVRIYKTFDWENNSMIFYGW